MKVSFDFDSTLSRKAVQKYAKELMKRGYEVHIVTTRFEDPMRYTDPRWQILGHRDMFRVCFYLGIPRERIHFQNMADKFHYFQYNVDFLFHLDDDENEIESMNMFTNVVAIHCDKGMLWKEKLQEIILKKGL